MSGVGSRELVCGLRLFDRNSDNFFDRSTFPVGWDGVAVCDAIFGGLSEGVEIPLPAGDHNTTSQL